MSMIRARRGVRPWSGILVVLLTAGGVIAGTALPASSQSYATPLTPGQTFAYSTQPGPWVLPLTAQTSQDQTGSVQVTNSACLTAGTNFAAYPGNRAQPIPGCAGPPLAAPTGLTVPTVTCTDTVPNCAATTYQYEVTAVVGQSTGCVNAPSGTVDSQSPPSAPTTSVSNNGDDTTGPSGGSNAFSWTGVVGADYYDIYVKATGMSSYQYLNCSNANSYTDNGSNWAPGGNIPGGSGTTSTAQDSSGSGVLRLTTSNNYEIGGAYFQQGFPTNEGLDISFESNQYFNSSSQPDGFEAADGIGFALAAVNPTNPSAPADLGPDGGGLGYASNTFGGTFSGLPDGFMGFGLDVLGHFEDKTFEGTGCGGGAQ